MFSRFFIERPIFANVIAVVTIIFGVVALRGLPVEQYPQITPPTVRVTTTYPGANATVVANTVAAPIEQQVNGVERMIYMSSNSSSNGSYTLTVTFDVGTDIDVAQTLVQNRVQVALPQLPQEVQRQGLVTKKQSTDIILFVVLTATDTEHNNLFLSNFATINLLDELARLPGVGDINVVWATNYSMRLWLDPEKLKARNLTTDDVVKAIQEQNVQVAAGQIGQPPTAPDQTFQYTITTLGRLTTPKQFEDIIVKSAPGPAAQITRVRDVARVELGAQTYDQFFQVNGKPAAGLAVYQLPGANALEVADRVRARMEQLKSRFPQGVVYSIPFDTTRFVSAAIEEVYWTLLEAGGLVLLVILLFLQDWRAVLVPATTVPVTIIGAFAAMWAFGFTVNMLTLFGLVLAIGIVVDDAIVIVENATRHIEMGQPPKEATIRAMDELFGPIVGITLVLSAVFLPAAFLGGVTGQLYRQFALTIAATAIISAVNAMTLKPAQSAAYLRPVTGKRRFFIYRAFNWSYDRLERGYAAAARQVLRVPALVMLLYVGLAVLAGWTFLQLPTGFLPVEDQGYFIVSMQLPDAAALPRTERIVNQVEQAIHSTPGAENINAVVGQSVLEQTAMPNAAACYVTFKDWSERTDLSESQGAILGALARKFNSIPGATILAFPPPAIRGLGVSGGFQMEMQLIGSQDLETLERATRDLVAAGNSQSQLRGLVSPFSAHVPQLYLNVDRTKVKSLNLPLNLVFGTLQTYLGSTYVNDFNQFGRTYQVRLQADSRYRDRVEDITRLEVRNTLGQMVPLGSVLKVERQLGPTTVTRYNLYPAASITGQAASGVSSGQALDLMEETATRRLPPGMGFEWTTLAYQERQVGQQAIYVFALAVLLVYLILAAKYESWLNPLAVILVVPLALLGTLAALVIRGFPNDVYAQIGIVLIIALASKNAILIVEFAQDLRRAGRSVREAALEAAKERFRPILMTSIAFILGVVPLVFARGAGAASRQALGTAVFGGMIAATLLSVFFVPVFYVLLEGFSEWWEKHKPIRLRNAE